MNNNLKNGKKRRDKVPASPDLMLFLKEPTEIKISFESSWFLNVDHGFYF